MSRNQLIDSYQTGRIGRRTFIKGMVGLGLSASVATALADKVRAAPTSSPAKDDIYDPGAPVTGLPNTGIGQASSSSKNTGATLAVLGAGAAAVAGMLRRKANTAPESED
jgi:hypothetical protein